MTCSSLPVADFKPTISEDPERPSEGFDPVHNAEDAAQLSKYWLPARPDPDTQPELYAHWEEMFWPPPQFVHAQSNRPMMMDKYPHEPGFWQVSTRLESSRNWSGAYLECKDANRFARVVGAWTVPFLHPGVRTKEDGTQPFQCSMWIGLDGKKLSSRSMPQVGTEQRLNPKTGAQEQHLWWEWWRRGDPKPEIPAAIEGVKIEAGHRVLCSISVLTPKIVRIHVVNRTLGLFATVQLTGGEPLLGASAEWIVERQSDYMISNDFLYPLPDYTEATFEKCAVENLDVTVPAPAWVPRYIRMIQHFKEQGRIAVISTPRMYETPRNVRVLYHRPFHD